LRKIKVVHFQDLIVYMHGSFNFRNLNFQCFTYIKTVMSVGALT
jgi:hypothetical protein